LRKKDSDNASADRGWVSRLFSGWKEEERIDLSGLLGEVEMLMQICAKVLKCQQELSSLEDPTTYSKAKREPFREKLADELFHIGYAAREEKKVAALSQETTMELMRRANECPDQKEKLAMQSILSELSSLDLLAPIEEPDKDKPRGRKGR